MARLCPEEVQSVVDLLLRHGVRLKPDTEERLRNKLAIPTVEHLRGLSLLHLELDCEELGQFEQWCLVQMVDANLWEHTNPLVHLGVGPGVSYRKILFRRVDDPYRIFRALETLRPQRDYGILKALPRVSPAPTTPPAESRHSDSDTETPSTPPKRTRSQ
jgi:hypothetical protein